jgi:hypothetical protein
MLSLYRQLPGDISRLLPALHLDHRHNALVPGIVLAVSAGQDYHVSHLIKVREPPR